TNRKHISKRFPNIKSVTLINYNMQSSGNRIVLQTLNQWSDQLTDLRIIGFYNWRGLVKSLNRLSCLQSLSADIEIDQIAQLEVMPRLKQLNCTCWNVSSDFTAMLDKCLRK